LKGIGKLEIFLKELKIDKVDEIIQFLKDLQSLRSTGAAHRKGKKYEEVALRFDIRKKELKKVFESIMVKSLEILKELEATF
jgi:hypothetical protein